ncbi:MAG: outer membrane lipoprotein-sorting protein [bacterium]|nr:outer membrane lipoprotein-sorting protein [bacterium]
MHPFTIYLFIWLLCVPACFASDSVSSSSIDLVDYVRRSETQYLAKTSYAMIEMKIERRTWNRRMVMKNWGEGRDKFLARIIEPLKERGTSTLKLNDNIWNYLPKIDRIMKVPSSLMGDSWMGSHFTNDDLVKGNKIDQMYDFSLMKESAQNIWIQALPKEDAATVWGKIIYNMERVRKVAETVEYFDEDNELVRTISFHDIKELDGRHIPMRMIVTPEDEPNESTLISYKELTFDKPLPKGLFSVRNLKRK